jgi:hypothetical protein
VRATRTNVALLALVIGSFIAGVALVLIGHGRRPEQIPTVE